MGRQLTAIRVPVDLLREVVRLLGAAEGLPLVGEDARRAGAALVALRPEVLTVRDAGPTCVVCGGVIPAARRIVAAQRGREALYDSDRCRETASARRHRARKVAPATSKWLKPGEVPTIHR